SDVCSSDLLSVIADNVRMGSSSRRARARPRSSAPTAATAIGPDAATDLTRVVGENLHRLRSERGLSFEKLAQQSGVSRAMLGQIELGQSAPTINVLWKIARGLGVHFSSLLSAESATGPTVLRVADARLLTSSDRR